jgi:crotonobetainyl-CoA:carnitine CoA-transferase CaiB-like acyl-CoA transferase
MDDAPGALDGLVVLDATQMLAGPLAATRLGDLGADVIKLEPPDRGEFNRTHGFEDLRVGGEMTTFLAVNRNKRSLALDLKHPEARDVLHRLLPSVDVVIQNFRPQTAARLGMDWSTLQAINPRLVYCSISGYGSEGPYRDRPGQDLVVQGYSGSMFSVGADGEDPSPGALWAADVMTGYQAAIGVLAALASRERTGVGQQVEVDMLSVVLDAQAQELVTYLNTGRQPQRTAERTAHGSIPAPYGVYRTADGWLTLAMCPLPALGEVLDDDVLRSYVHYNDGHRHRDEVYGRIRNRFVQRTTDEWLQLCDQHGVWAGPVYDYGALERDPHVRATGAFVDQPQGDSVIRTTRVPIRMSATPPTIRRGAPQLGADTVDVLSAVGFTGDEVARLAADGVVGTRAEAGVPVSGRGAEVTA